MALGRGYALPFVAGKQGAGGGGGAYGLLWQDAVNDNVPPLTLEDGNAGQGSCLFTRGKDLYDKQVSATPSLLIVPQMYGSGKLAVDIPSPEFFNVTRATTATRVNSSGLIESVASGVPRLDWLASGGVTGCPALLVEPAATNLVLQSRDLSVSGSWTASGITAVRNATGADGTASGACTLTSTAADATIVQNLSHASQSRIFSASIRRVSGSGGIELTTNGGTNWTAVTITTAFTRVACDARTVASGQVGIRMKQSDEVIEVDFTQGEVGPVATSPIPTTTGSASRNADQITASGSVVSGLIGQTEGTLYFEFQASPSGASSNWINISDGTENNWMFIGKDSDKCRAYIRANNVVIFTPQTFVLTNSAIKAALAYKSGDYALYINGTLNASGTTAFTFSAALTSIQSGFFTPQASNEISRYRAIALYTTRLSNDQLATLTS